MRNATLDDALTEAREAYEASNPGSAAAHARAVAVLPGGNTRTVLFHDPFPLAIARGEGAHVTDVDGHAYVNFVGEMTAGLFGHAHKVIRAAIDAALDGGITLSGQTEAETVLASAIVERFPAIERVRFTNSGTEGNLMALALALAVTGRRRVMVFGGGYHGGVLYFGAQAGGYGSPVNVPHNFIVAPYNDLDGTRALADRQLAAILVEPLQGSGGCIPADAEFLHGLRALADETGAVLIFDEVMTSRLAPGGLHGAHGVAPDLVTLGKYVGGGMSFGAFGGRADLMDRFDPRRPDALPHAGTFNNNVLTMAAGAAGLRVYDAAACVALNARGDRMRRALNTVAVRHEAGWQAMGCGSMIALHPVAGAVRCSADLAGADARARALLQFDLFSRGLFTARRGMSALSMPVTEAECEGFVAAFDEFLTVRGAVLAH